MADYDHSIDKKDLQLAPKFETRRATHERRNGDPTLIYHYCDIAYVANAGTDR
jgi:hypothetical protein